MSSIFLIFDKIFFVHNLAQIQNLNYGFYLVSENLPR